MKKLLKSIILKYKYLNLILTYLYHKLWLYDIYRIFNISFLVQIRDVSFRMYPKGQVTKILFMNKFEEFELDLYSRLIKPGMTVIDAGANVGLYSLIASKIVGDKGRIYSFEPSFDTYQRLIENLKINQAFNVFPQNLGLGDKVDQELTLRQDHGFEDAERYLVPENVEINSDLANVNSITKVEQIRVTTLDDFLSKLGIGTIDFLKIDTEGFEYYILNGARDILKASEKLIILLECTKLGTERSNSTQKQVFDILLDSNFTIYYWNSLSNKFCSDLEGCYNSGELWACKSEFHLSSLF